MGERQWDGGRVVMEQLNEGDGGWEEVSISRARREDVLAAGWEGRVLIGYGLD